MSLIVGCRSCGKKYELTVDKAGKKFKCACGAIIAVQSAAAATEETDPWDSPEESPNAPLSNQSLPPPVLGLKSKSIKAASRKGKSQGSSGALIAGIIGVAFAALALLAVGAWFLFFRKAPEEPVVAQEPTAERAPVNQVAEIPKPIQPAPQKKNAETPPVKAAVSTPLPTETPPTPPQPTSLKFAGRNWTVRKTETGEPGPNRWNENNAFVDAEGLLHLKLSPAGNVWECAEVFTQEPLGFGLYQFQVISPVDKLNRNVVLGLFNQPTPDVGLDRTNEIHIDFSRRGNVASPPGHYTVGPTKTGVTQVTRTFPIKLHGDYTTHRFLWNRDRVQFQSIHGHHEQGGDEFSRWGFQPQNPTVAIPQQPTPIHLNLWCFKGKPPSDAKPVEVIIKSFSYSPI